MRKPISTKVHGVLDYVTGAALMALPSMLGWRRKPSMLLEGSGAMAAAYSLITDYELSVAKLLPMKAHLTMDALSGGMLLGAAMLMDEDDDVRMTIAGIGVWEIMAALMTETEPEYERQGRNGQNGRSAGRAGKSRGRGRRTAESSRETAKAAT